MKQSELFPSTKGVKPRYDGKGDVWADKHRKELGIWYHMQDVDGYFASFCVATNTANRLFYEYVPDEYENRYEYVRDFGIIAFFDRKRSENFARSPENTLCTATYLHLCRMLAAVQPSGPRFFWVIGSNEPPWEMIELNIYTGIEETRTRLEKNLWKEIWEKTGLTEVRKELESWLYSEDGKQKMRSTKQTLKSYAKGGDSYGKSS